MNDAFIENLYGDMRSLFHLDQIQVSGEKTESAAETAPAPIPAESKILLGTLAGIWILIGVSRLISGRKAKKK